MGYFHNIYQKLSLLAHFLKWRAIWNHFLLDYREPNLTNPKFMTAREAVKLIPDHSVIATSGLAANQRASILFRAIRDAFQTTQHPRGLTVMSTGGQGGFGKVPGTVEEFGLPGLCTRFITAHFDTFRVMLKLAVMGQLELQCLPQGILALLFAGQGQGQTSLVASTGIGTFLDPRCGRGSPILDPKAKQFISVEGEQLRYELPPIQVALFNAPAADEEGNIYVKNCAMIAESREIAYAACQNHGVVIANVGMIVKPGYDEIFLPADKVTAIVVEPNTEQTASVPHKKYWSFFTTHSHESMEEGLRIVRFSNRLLGLTPKRTAQHSIIARTAALLLAQKLREENKFHAFVNIGTGIPEEVSRLLYEGGLISKIQLFTESGVIGGLPAPGIFFGAEICPQQIVSSAEIFRRCYQHLDVAIFGMLQADSDGNVNVSKKSEQMKYYVGPGGFMDLSTNAKIVIFAGTWMNHSQIQIVKTKQSACLKIIRHGQPKFVDHVQEITFNGKRALERGQQVFFVTEVGIFQLTPQGMLLRQIMPGIRLDWDISRITTMKFILPDNPSLIDPVVIHGHNFSLHLDEPKS